jgi:hypothetical protein
MFTHDIRNRITVGSFQASLDEFLLLEPSYHLPDGALWQFYVPGVKHLVGYGLKQRREPLPWTDGDTYIAREAEYDTARPDPRPNVKKFTRDLIIAFGGNYLAINALYAQWPLFKEALEAEQWPLVELVIQQAYATHAIDANIYSAILVAAKAYNLPIQLKGNPRNIPLASGEIMMFTGQDVVTTVVKS